MSRQQPLLRPMRWPDLPQVHQIETACFTQDPWSLAGLWSELAARPRRDYTVLDAGEVRGYAGLDLAGDTADVMTIAVAPQWRGQGHGPRLLGHLLQRAAQAGASQVMLEVREDNEAAIGLYARHGFQEVHRRRGYYQPGAVDALVMRREVTAGA